MSEPRVNNTDGLWKKFRNFDEQEVYNEVCEGAKKTQANNFVVLFGPQHAKVAVDLGADDFKDLFNLSKADYPVRWINFWNTTKQGDAINIIGDKYGFSRRLRASIIVWDKYRTLNRDADQKKRELKERSTVEEECGGIHIEKADLESGLSGKSEQLSQPGGSSASWNSEHSDPEVMENFKVIQNSLNYTTTDYGADCEWNLFLEILGACHLQFSSCLFWRQLVARATDRGRRTRPETCPPEALGVVCPLRR